MEDPRVERVEGIVHRDGVDVGRYLRRRLLSDEVDDALAEVWLVVWRRSDSIPEGVEPARRWLFVVAANVVRSARRRAGRRRRLETELFSAPPRPVGAVEEARVAHLSAWAALSERDRVVLRIAATVGSGRPLAIALGVTDAVAAARLHRARARLRTLLDG